MVLDNCTKKIDTPSERARDFRSNELRDESSKDPPCVLDHSIESRSPPADVRGSSGEEMMAEVLSLSSDDDHLTRSVRNISNVSSNGMFNPTINLLKEPRRAPG
ncbi:hypothetical protein AVEN_113079-1 [Araneus ventricosus]|uniref:Uncharacterized protein n=1 Tax=Araneus ventricosus TaxID=182803 RepID=A0A4Y2IS78_ARAVE|nr:hypothetical protein AVEN_113079-1 [Araneus ventricosus]